ncbi:hypothetical protein F5888DRAFT_1876261 [Russula emetica]|nr:hypothetical protein F5888DRAFT_1876261 [Russula emetica]
MWWWWWLCAVLCPGMEERKESTWEGGEDGRTSFETLCGRNMLKLLEVLNGWRLLLRIRLETVRWIREAVRRTGVSQKDVAGDDPFDARSRLSSGHSGEMGVERERWYGSEGKRGMPLSRLLDLSVPLSQASGQVVSSRLRSAESEQKALRLHSLALAGNEPALDESTKKGNSATCGAAEIGQAWGRDKRAVYQDSRGGKVLTPDEKASSDTEATDSEPMARVRHLPAQLVLGGGVTMISRPSVDPLDTVTGVPFPMMAPASLTKPNPGCATLARTEQIQIPPQGRSYMLYAVMMVWLEIVASSAAWERKDGWQDKDPALDPKETGNQTDRNALHG